MSSPGRLLFMLHSVPTSTTPASTTPAPTSTTPAPSFTTLLLLPPPGYSSPGPPSYGTGRSWPSPTRDMWLS